MMTAADLAAIRERAEKATPGPWEVPDFNDGAAVMDASRSVVTWKASDTHRSGPAQANAAFIAAARSDIPALLVEVDRLAGELARVTAMLSDVSAQRETYRVDLIIARKRISELERETEQLARAYRNL